MLRPLVIPNEIGMIDNPHILAARQKFTTWDDVTRLPKAQFVFLCFTNRCGSNYIAQSLASDGRLNIAGEFFNADTIHDEPFGPTDLIGYFLGLNTREGKNGYLVAKIAITQVKMLNELGVLSALIPNSKFIFVRRSDILGQAISLDIAWQNQQWDSSITPTIPESDLVFSADRLSAILAGIINQNALFDQFFAANDIFPYAINYEQFVQHPGFILEDISTFIGLSPPIRHIPSAISVRRQSGHVNQMWRDRFVANTSEQ